MYHRRMSDAKDSRSKLPAAVPPKPRAAMRPIPTPDGFMTTAAKMSLADIALALRDEQLEAKVRALKCYESQLVANQPAGRPGVIDTVCDRTRFWGHLIGVGHAEPFASREPVGLSGLEQLLL